MCSLETDLKDGDIMASIFKQQYTAKDPNTGRKVKKKSACWVTGQLWVGRL